MMSSGSTTLRRDLLIFSDRPTVSVSPVAARTGALSGPSATSTGGTHSPSAVR